MYSDLVSIQILISLMKKHNVRNIVISAGQSNNSFARSVEHDDFFKCYSVVDERSAAFFAVGLSLELNEPVAISCTASTACCNYISAITEAFYREIPILILTSNYDIRHVDQLKLLAIHQENMFAGICKKEVQLPEVIDKPSFVYCERLINSAILELDHHGKGPVHIDVPSYGASLSVSTSKLPDTRAIFRHGYCENWGSFAKRLKKCSKIMLVCGQAYYSEKEVSLIREFQKKFGCVVAGEHMANIFIDEYVNMNPIVSNYGHNALKEYAPDIMITMGRHVQFDWRLLSGLGIKHWLVSESGEIVDSFDSLTDIFEATKPQFLEKMISECDTEYNDNLEFRNKWKSAKENIRIPELSMSHIYSIKRFTEIIPSNSILHLSIFNSIRITQYFELPKNVRTYANLGALGIDGSMSTFLGQASVIKDKAFLIIGDLSFFYDMNSIMIRHIKENVRILLLNNFGGAEFYQNNGWYDTIDNHTAAKHNKSAKGWIKSNGFKYLSASSKEEYELVLKEFVAESDVPIVLEVFNNMMDDSKALTDLKNANKTVTSKDFIVGKMKTALGPKLTKKIKKILRK